MDTPDGDAGHGAGPDVSNASGARSSLGTFVGRDRELNQGVALLDTVATGEGRLLLVAGEPGIGKSRLADELARQARDRGFQVTWGRCWEAGGAPAYWPWVQSLRTLVRGVPAAALRAQLGETAPAMAQLLPELRTTIGQTALHRPQDPDEARFQLFDAVTALLKQSALAQPLMVVLDDLQVADTPSLLLLRFFARLLDGDRIFLVATYRDTDPTVRDPLAEALSDLMRCRAASRITLRGIAESDVPRFIEAVTGVVPQDRVARTVHHETEGNPLFLEEVARVLLDEGKLDAKSGVDTSRVPVPPNMRDVITRRLRPFSPECLRVLRLAAVLGREFGIDALSRLAHLPGNDLLQLLQRPLDEHVIAEAPDSRGRMRFGHMLIRECLYEDIGRSERREFHRTALEVLEDLYRSNIEPHLSELAHHAYEAAGEGNYEQAIDYARRAGDQALALLAYEEAVRLQRLALDSLAQSGKAHPARQCVLLLVLGDALDRSGDEASAKASFFQAAQLARRVHSNDHLATAALGYAGRHAWGRAGGDTQLVPLLKAGVDAVGDADSILRARLLARLAGALRDEPDREPRESFGHEAVAIARRLGHPATLAYALDGLVGATYRPDNPEQRLAVADEIALLGEAALDRELQLWGHLDRLLCYFEMGELVSVHEELTLIETAAGELRQPVMRWLDAGSRAALALAEGRLSDAEALAATALNLGQGSRSADAVSAFAGQMFQLRREQDRLDEVADLVRRAAREFPWYPIFTCALAVLDYERGRESQSRAVLDTFAATDFARIHFDNYWVFNMTLLGELAHSLRHQATATAIYERLRPYAMRNAFAPPEGCLGSVSRVLALLAEALSRPDDAARHFEAALAHNELMGARSWLAHTQHDFGVALLKRGGAEPRRRGHELLRAARSTCDELGMVALRKKIAAVLDEQPAATGVYAGAASTGGPQPGQPTAAGGALALEGEYWAVTFEGRTVRLRDSKGMRILARLLASPGRPHPSLDLERIDEAGDDAAARAIAASDAGELLDGETRRAYRARIAELRESIEDAQSLGPAAQAGALREELEFITRELSRGVGLGGRARRAGSAAERARLNVTRAVKAALQRVADADAHLAAHLGATVRTGAVCVYAPDPRSPLEWTVRARPQRPNTGGD